VNTNKHQWIRSSDSAEEKDGIENDERLESTLKNNISGNNTVVDAVTDKVVTGSNSKKEKDGSLPLQEYSHRIMKKDGQHKLILSSKTKTRSVAATAGISGDSLSAKEQDTRQPATTQGQTLRREGRNKLVSLSTSNAVKNATEQQKQDPSTNNGFRGRQNNTSCIGGTINRRKKPVPPSTSLRPTAKRVKLSVQPCRREVTIACDKLKEDSDCSQTAAVMETNDSKSKPTEKLSDFAYREISRVRQRPTISRQNLHWSKQSNNESCKTSLPSSTFAGNPNKRPKIKNMGLVRVQPDEKNTPICPTFLRGLHCQNRFCLKRHDIPKEFAVPVCSFFQRHGQCLRGDTCVFRHVKLNPNAMVCPSFAVLGFCEDEKCTMQHVCGRKAANGVGVNNTRAIGTKESLRKKPNNVYHRDKSTSGGRAKDT
jgi:hypothetical protein